MDTKVAKISNKFDLGTHWIYPLSFSTLIFVLYLSTLSNHYTSDSLTYALVIERGEFRTLIDPTHLLLHPLGWAWYQLWLLLGWSEGSLLPLEILNALAGAVAVGLVFQVARGVTKSFRIALIVATGFVVSGGTWLLSVEAEFVTVPLVTTLIVLLMLLSPPKNLGKHPFFPLAIGSAVALSVLAYLSNLLLIPVAFIGRLSGSPRNRNLRLRSIILFTLPILTIAIPFLWASISLSLDGEWSRLGNQMGFDQYGQISWTNIPQGIYGFLRSLALFQNLAMNDSTAEYLRSVGIDQQLLFLIYYIVVFSVATLPILYLIHRREQLLSQNRRPLTILVTWAALSAAFGFIWVPGDISFWIPVLTAWWLLLGMALAHRTGEDSHSKFKDEFLAITFTLLLFIANFQMVIGPRMDLETNAPYRTSQVVAGNTDEKDVIITDVNTPEALYVAYFSRRATLSSREIGLSDYEMLGPIDGIFTDLSGFEGEVFVLRDGTLMKLDN